jgi:cellulose synthase operon protein C
MKIKLNNNVLNVGLSVVLCLALAGCSTPEEKAKKYYDKGIELLESNPEKAKLEFQNALQIKRNMTPAIYGLALAAEKQADWKACFAMLNKVIQEDPAHVDANVKIGQLYLAAGNLEQAQKFLDKSKTLAPTNINVMLLDAAMDLKNKHFSDAVLKANAVLKQDNKSKEALMILATERFQARDLTKSLEYLDRGLAIEEKNLSMQMFKVEVLKTKGDYSAAVSAYQKAIASYPENYMLRTALAQYYFDNNKKNEAETELKIVMDKQPTLVQPKLDYLKLVAATKGEMEARLALESMVKNNPQDFDLSFYLVDYYDRKAEKEASNSLLKQIIVSAGDKPEGLKAKIKVAYRMLQLGKKEEANKLIDEVLSADKGQEEALLLKASIQMDEANFDSATVTLRTLLRDKPESTQGLFMLAKNYELSGSTALADENYVQAMAISKDAPNISIPFAQSLFKRKENTRAEKVLEDSLKRNPTNADVIKFLAQLKITNGDLAGAQELAQHMTGTANENLSNLIEGAVLLKKNDVAGSLGAFKKAHEAAPKDMQAILAVVNTYVSQKKFTEAQQFLGEVLSKDTGNYGVKLLLAQVDALSGNTEKSFQSYENAIADNPNNIKAYQALATGYFKAQQPEKAVDVIQRGLKALPNSFDLKMMLAEVRMATKSYAEAINVYDDLYKTNPDSMIALNNYVSVVADYETDKDKMNHAYDLAQKLKKANAAQFLDTLGWVSYRVGKYDEAIEYLKAAEVKAPNYAVFQYHLGKVYLASGDKAKAKVCLEKALQLTQGQNFDYSVEIKELLKSV